MKSLFAALTIVLAAGSAAAQVPVIANPDQAAMLASADARLAANKRLVYDFWREVFEGGHMELADKYMAESYIQHNPMVPTGRAAFVEAFGKRVKPAPIDARVKAPLVAIVAEGDLVVLHCHQEWPTDANRDWAGIDIFRLDADGKVVEHWDVLQVVPETTANGNPMF